MGKELEDIKQKYLTVLEVSMVFISFHQINGYYLAFFMSKEQGGCLGNDFIDS